MLIQQQYSEVTQTGPLLSQQRKAHIINQQFRLIRELLLTRLGIYRSFKTSMQEAALQTYYNTHGNQDIRKNRKALDGKYFHDYTDDASWGPKMEGQEYVPWYAWVPGTKYSFKTATLLPLASQHKRFLGNRNYIEYQYQFF